MPQPIIKIRLLSENALKANVDVLALKYAQENYGLDAEVSRILVDAGIKATLIRPKPDEFKLVEAAKGITAKNILFVGVLPLYSFGYGEIRDFSRRVISCLSKSVSNIRRIALTLHGVGYGLDEVEAFESEVAGLLDAIRSFEFPENLSEIFIVEGNQGRAERLKPVLQNLIPNGEIFANSRKNIGDDLLDSSRFRAVGFSSSAKNHVFVAMPFKDEMSDLYHYGIQGSVRNAGFLCERADLSSFAGDVMHWVRERIKTATLVIADLTESNPNVYLEVGYAWGCGIPTVLIVKDTDHLKFDTRGQRCLPYKNIKGLEDLLTKELKALQKNGTI